MRRATASFFATTAATARLARAAMASVTRVTAADEPALSAALAAHCGQPGVGVLVLFTGAGEPSWCGDCTDAKPVIEAALARAEAPVVLVTVPLARDEYKGNAAHWARCVGWWTARRGRAPLAARHRSPPRRRARGAALTWRRPPPALPARAQRAPRCEAPEDPHAVPLGGQRQAASQRAGRGAVQGGRRRARARQRERMSRVTEMARAREPQFVQRHCHYCNSHARACTLVRRLVRYSLFESFVYALQLQQCSNT